ncbi:DUF4064 domain-containing protein [Indiicoccus explosivorum]|uniref:DUF4064 domain-containing protein n=1 Tax=Indiicoccus explosivorum TaxID=1917864 RepID=UPI000B439D2B|nr:DUF4064 domain-containing protein [Indiicoccus explosivorum]
MYGKPFSRTWEKALGIIGIVLNVTVIILTIIAIINIGGFEGSVFEAQLQEDILNDPTLTPEEAEATVALVSGFTDIFGVFGWVIVAVLALASALAVVAIINLNDNKKPKLAGILFVIAGILSGLLSLTALIFYVAAIMCFVRRPPLAEEPVLAEDPQQPDLQREEDSPYRPL